MTTRGRHAIVGLVALTVLAAGGWVLFLFLGGAFKPGFEVTATFERAGQLLRAGSDVKARGVLVGEVSSIAVNDRGNAQVTMRILPDAADELPDDVTAAIRAKTLFGEKFVELRIPEDAGGRTLEAGDHIPLERTTGPFEVETILRKSVPLLSAIDPENLAAALDALAQGFVGNEQALRRATLQGERVLDGTAGTLPEFERNLVHLRNFGAALDDVDRELLEALAGLELAGRAIDRRSTELETVLATLPRLARDLGDVFHAREQDLFDLAEQGADVLGAVQDKAPDLPDIVRLLDGFFGVWIADLSVGPYWRIFVTEAPTLDAHAYPPGEGPRPRSSGVDRSALLDAIADPGDGGRSLTDLLLAPVPTERLPGVAERLGHAFPEVAR